MKTIKKLWGIYYDIKINGRWCRDWTGPCGIYIIGRVLQLSDESTPCLNGQPFLFKTRKLASKTARSLNNLGPNNIRYSVLPVWVAYCDTIIR